MFTRILVPLDGSNLAETVLPLVERLATATGGAVLLLHVLERGARAEIHGERHLTGESDVSSYLSAITERLRSKGIPVESHFHDAPEGDVARSIAAHAEEEGADVIVLCTHGFGQMRHRLFGNIAQKVLHRGDVPIILVRPDVPGADTGFEPGRILVALDGTAAAEAALPPAAAMAAALNASLHLVMAVDSQDSARGDRPAATLLPSTTRAILDLEEEHAADYLEGLASGLRSDRQRVTTEVRRGSPASTLVEEASEPGVGLVVLATHGRAGVQAIWAGSVTAQLLGRTCAPVMLLRLIET